MADIASVDEIGGGDFAALPEVNRFAAIQAMDADAKGRLLALLVARQINGGETSGSRRDRRHQRFDQIAFASGVDMVAKWQAPVAFYDRLKKPVIAKIMTEVLGKAAADNCAKMKKGDLAAAAAERMAGRGWLPPALVIAEPELEAEDEPAPFEDGEARMRTRSRLMHGEGGPEGPPSFPQIQVRAPRPCWTDRRPLVPSGQETVQQLVAATPIAREG